MTEKTASPAVIALLQRLSTYVSNQVEFGANANPSIPWDELDCDIREMVAQLTGGESAKKSMTVEEFITQFGPEFDRNNNCLEDKACPKCGSRGSFHIACTTIMDVDDSGTDDPQGAEWDENSYIQCRHCDHDGTVGEFTIDGLDAAIAKLQKG